MNERVSTTTRLADALRSCRKRTEAEDWQGECGGCTPSTCYCKKEHDEHLAMIDAALPGEPIDMVLFCPKCGTQHIDAVEPRFADNGADDTVWKNPPHRSHLCHSCGCIWRPADVATNGVKAITTRGKADTWNGDGALPFHLRTPASQAAKHGKGDWTEDFAHENGNYTCQCCYCGRQFIGHKRRVTCKVCATHPAQATIKDGG